MDSQDNTDVLNELKNVIANLTIGKEVIAFPENDFPSEIEEIYTDLKQYVEQNTVQKEELNKKNKQLLESHIKNQSIINNIGEGLVVIDIEANVEYINNVALKLLGIKRGFFENKKWIYDFPKVESLEGDSVEDKNCASILACSNKKVSASFLYVLEKDNKIPVKITASPIISGNKQVGVVLLIQDITEAVQVDKAKSEFLTIASHQMRTPLSTLRWNIQLLIDSNISSLNAKQISYLENIESGARSMSTLITALLQMTKIELGTVAYRTEEVDLGMLYEKVVKDLAHLIHKKGMKMNFDFEQGFKSVSMDPNLFQIVMQSLLENAIKYSSDYTNISVKIEVGSDFVVLYVIDEGIGIPLDEQTKVFSKSFRASNAPLGENQGTGLGLYITKEIVEKVMQGNITFKSEAGKGSTFVVSVPLTKKNSALII